MQLNLNNYEAELLIFAIDNQIECYYKQIKKEIVNESLYIRRISRLNNVKRKLLTIEKD